MTMEKTTASKKPGVMTTGSATGKAIGVGLAALSIMTLSIMNAAQAETRDYTVESFTGVRVSTGIVVNISVGGVQSITAEGRDDSLDRLLIENNNGILRIKRKRKKGWGWGKRRDRFTVDITVPSLTSIDVSSGSSVDATGVAADDFALDASSGADIEVAGTCSAVSADASSGASIDARDLVCRIATADVSSGASIDVHATEKFTGEASSGGGISVYGKPTDISSSKSSGGGIKIR